MSHDERPSSSQPAFHPGWTHFPVALWSTAFFFDLLSFHAGNSSQDCSTTHLSQQTIPRGQLLSCTGS